MTGGIIHITLLLAALSRPDAGSAAPAPTGDGGTGAPTKLSPRAEVESVLGKAAGGVEFQRLATTSPAILIAIASDPAASATVRGRALSALAYAQNQRVQAFLESFIIGKALSRDTNDRVLLRHAVVALGWQGDVRIVETVGPLLDHADPEVRLDAAVALGLGRTRSAEAPLRARLATETDPAVRRQLEASLKSVTAPR